MGRMAVRNDIRYLFALLLLSLSVVSHAQVFEAREIPDSVWEYMQGRSYPEGCTVARRELRFLSMSYYDFEGCGHVGSMVCNRLVAEDLLYIFRRLYEARYPIAGMHLIDEYDAVDSLSMADNNTSCFCYRRIAGSNRLSAHSRGMAVDVNPLYNPCLYVNSGRVVPPDGEKYARDRQQRSDIPGKIDTDDLCYRLFIARGFRWGGHWRSLKDYQHFEK